MTESILPQQHEIFFDGDVAFLTISQPTGAEFEIANEIEINGQHNVEAFIKSLCERTGFYPVNPKTIGTISSGRGFQSAYNIDQTGGAA